MRVAGKEEEVQRILQQVKRFNMNAPTIWKEEYSKLFDAEYLYIRKVAESFRLPLGDLMNFQPDEPTPRDATIPPKETPPAPSVEKESYPETDVKNAP